MTRRYYVTNEDDPLDYTIPDEPVNLDWFPDDDGSKGKNKTTRYRVSQLKAGETLTLYGYDRPGARTRFTIRRVS